MDTYNRILKEQQERRAAQSIKDKAMVFAITEIRVSMKVNGEQI